MEQLEELLHRPAGAPPVLRRDDVEEEPADDGERQTGLVARPTARKHREPVFDERGEETVEGLLAVRAACVALEEQPLERPECRVAESGPRRRHGVLGAVGE